MTSVPGFAFFDISGTILVGGVSQQIAAVNEGRMYLLIQNLSSDNLWVNFGIPAVQNQPSIRLSAGSSIEFNRNVVPTSSINIVGPTAGQAFTAKQL